MKIRIPRSRKWLVVGLVIVAVIIVVGFFVRPAVQERYAKIPTNISDKLLFTPYAVGKLPTGYGIDADSFKLQETALIFTASNASGQQFVFSEQSVPKDLDMNGFYGNAITRPQRLEGLKNRTIFGKLQAGNGTLASIVTTDNTWILVTMPKAATKDTASTISQGLVQQQ